MDVYGCVKRCLKTCLFFSGCFKFMGFYQEFFRIVGCLEEELYAPLISFSHLCSPQRKSIFFIATRRKLRDVFLCLCDLEDFFGF